MVAPELNAEVEAPDHWALQPIIRPAVPEVPESLTERVRNPIDAFVLARLTAEKLTPSPEASPSTLLRRLHLDLTGLPPSPQAIRAFL